MHHPRRGLGDLVVLTLCLTLSGYFTFAAVQGDHGLFRRLAIEAEITRLEADRDAVAIRVDRMETLTRRLSDDHLDLDLLDERARDVLGLMRPDEIVLR